VVPLSLRSASEYSASPNPPCPIFCATVAGSFRNCGAVIAIQRYWKSWGSDQATFLVTRSEPLCHSLGSPPATSLSQYPCHPSPYLSRGKEGPTAPDTRKAATCGKWCAAVDTLSSPSMEHFPLGPLGEEGFPMIPHNSVSDWGLFCYLSF